MSTKRCWHIWTILIHAKAKYWVQHKQTLILFLHLILQSTIKAQLTSCLLKKIIIGATEKLEQYGGTLMLFVTTITKKVHWNTELNTGAEYFQEAVFMFMNGLVVMYYRLLMSAQAATEYQNMQMTVPT